MVLFPLCMQFLTVSGDNISRTTKVLTIINFSWEKSGKNLTEKLAIHSKHTVNMTK